MSGRFFKVICAAVLSIGLIGQANAVLLLSAGDIVKDIDFGNNGIQWEYVNSFNLADGPDFDDADGSCDLLGANLNTCWGDYANPLNGIQAAELLFVKGNNEVFAISTILTSVNHLAFYDEYKGNAATPKGESITADSDGDRSYSTFGDASAFINDKAASNVVNYVFKRTLTEVPEPFTLTIFALALLGLGARKLKR